ncbi:MAG: lysoplasmalogenase, partial [Lutimonas sp.]
LIETSVLYTMSKERLGNTLTWIFFIVTALDLIGVGMDIHWLELICKPMIMVSLMAFYWVVSPRRRKLYLAALFFSLLGDIFLLDKEGLFLMGIGAFLITQILFIVLVLSRRGPFSKSNLILSTIPFLIYLVLLMRTLTPKLGDLFYPVLIYGSVISVFGITALNYHLNQKNANSRILLTGAILFIASDSMIALNKFYSPHMIYPVAIMLTYALAQYLICHSMLMEEQS